MSPEHRARRLTLLAGAGAVVLWGCSGSNLQPGSLIDQDGAAGGAAGSPAPHVPGPCLEPAADAALARFQTGVVGAWMGTATPPAGWGWSLATVEFTFFCDGHYHARCLASDAVAPESCVALYGGTDDDYPEKTYEIYDVRSDGKATGSMVMVFDPSNTVLDKLEAIVLAAAADQLAFDFIHLGQYGPIHYDLQRVP